MDKPEDIPQDVWDEAEQIASDWAESAYAVPFVAELVSRAILKAKNDAYEEAALISDKYADYEHNWNSDTSDEIRNLKHEGER